MLGGNLYFDWCHNPWYCKHALCNTGGVINKGGGHIWLRQGRCKHTVRGCVCSYAHAEGFFYARIKHGVTHPALPRLTLCLSHTPQTKQSKPNKMIPIFFKHRSSIILQVNTSLFTSTVTHMLSFSSVLFVSNKPSVALFSPPVKSERRRKQESSEAWPESRESMTSYGSIFQVQASSE